MILRLLQIKWFMMSYFFQGFIFVISVFTGSVTLQLTVIIHPVCHRGIISVYCCCSIVLVPLTEKLFPFIFARLKLQYLIIVGVVLLLSVLFYVLFSVLFCFVLWLIVLLCSILLCSHCSTVLFRSAICLFICLSCFVLFCSVLS